MAFVVMFIVAGTAFALINIWGGLMLSLNKKVATTPIAIFISVIIGGALGLVIAAGFGCVLELSNISQEDYLISETKIYSLADNIGYDGSFILGIGRT